MNSVGCQQQIACHHGQFANLKRAYSISTFRSLLYFLPGCFFSFFL